MPCGRRHGPAAVRGEQHRDRERQGEHHEAQLCHPACGQPAGHETGFLEPGSRQASLRDGARAARMVILTYLPMVPGRVTRISITLPGAYARSRYRTRLGRAPSTRLAKRQVVPVHRIAIRASCGALMTARVIRVLVAE